MGVSGVLEMGRQYGNEWVVLDRSWRVVDHGPELEALRDRHGGRPGRTFFFTPG